MKMAKSVGLHLIPSLLVVISIFIPFNLQLGGVIEEWWILGLFTTKGLFFFTTADSPVPAHALRPLTILPQAISYWLDAYSFDYWNITLALSIVIKGAFTSLLTTRVTENKIIGVLAALLIIVYPADTMQLSFRSLHINWALSLAIIASYLQLYSLGIEKPALGYATSCFAAIVLGFACAMYEASVLLAILPITMLWVKKGRCAAFTSTKTQWRKHLIWMIGVFLYGAYVIYTLPSVDSYQGKIIGTSSPIPMLINSLGHLFSTAYPHVLAGGWYDAFLITTAEISSYTYSIIVTTLLLTFTYTIRPIKTTANIGAAQGIKLRLTLAGIFFIAIGYAPFLLSIPHQYISQRTYLFSSLGATFTFLGVISYVTHHRAQLCIAAATPLLFIGLNSQLYQLHHYIKISDQQKLILQQIKHYYPDVPQDKTIFILDGTNSLGHTWMLPNENLLNALIYIYGHPIRAVEVCHTDTMEWQKGDRIGRKGTCEEAQDGWVFHPSQIATGPGLSTEGQQISTSLKNADTYKITLNMQEHFSAGTGDIGNASSRDSKIASGYLKRTDSYHLISFTDDTLLNHYKWTFGNWWSMELPITGSGWREAEWSIDKLHNSAAAWKVNELATLHFRLTPDNTGYKIKIKFDYIVSKEIRDSFQILVNDIPAAQTWESPDVLDGVVQDGTLKAKYNKITLISKTASDYYGYAAKINSISAYPIQQ